MKLFVDTSAFIALADRSDQHHLKADRFLKGLGREVTFHTSDYVIDETITRLRYTAGHHVALRFSHLFFDSKWQTIHYVDPQIEQEALERFEKYDDQLLTFTDCVTLAFLDRLGIRRIFAFDEDFRVLGYDLLPI